MIKYSKSSPRKRMLNMYFTKCCISLTENILNQGLSTVSSLSLSPSLSEYLQSELKVQRADLHFGSIISSQSRWPR